jgi:putative membrane-bound dehydrogenase-like protein
MSRSNPRIVLALSLAATLGTVSGSAPAAEFTLNGRAFTLPDGFVIETVAGPPLVDRPITADFDEQGRLYVADSSGSNDKVQQQLEQKPHRILRLEDSDGDGRFDKRTIYADRMMFPEGTLWYDGSLYVAAPPSIWKLTDADGDGVAEKRVEWFKGETLTGCANDLHGPYLGPDGWIYWCKGAFAKQTYERPGRPPFVTRAAHIFRARPDGSGIEPVMTGGMDNPVDVVFMPNGERIFSTTFLQHPGGGKRDGLIHAIYGGIYGKDHDPIHDPIHKWTGPDLMPPLVHLGPAAASGLTRYESTVFGDAYKDNLFACNFNLRKVTRHVLTPKGSTYESKDSDFLVSTHQDFHPTDVFEDADGSLIVIDTGGWYKLCCPTSQLHKPDVLGAIYRIRRAGAPKIEDPRGQKIAWDKASPDEVFKRLDDPRPFVRRRAIQETAKPERMTRLDGEAYKRWTPEARRNALWAAARSNTDDLGILLLCIGSFDKHETVRQVAIHGLSIHRSLIPLRADLAEQLRNPSAQTRRVAAEALGRSADVDAVLEDIKLVYRDRVNRLPTAGDVLKIVESDNSSVVPALLIAAGEPADRPLEHSLIYALIEITDPKATAEGLKSPNPRTRRAAMIALDQMGNNHLKPDDVAPGLASTDARTREVASWIVGRHPEWAGALAGFLGKRLKDAKLPDAERAELAGQLAGFAREGPIQTLLADTVRETSSPAGSRTAALRAMANSGLKQVPKTWVDGLAAVVSKDDPGLVREAVSAARALPLARDKAGELVAALVKLGSDAKAPATLRLDALAAVPGGLTEVKPALFDFLRTQLDPENPVTVRAAAADVLARAALDKGQLLALADAIKTTGPLEVDKLLTAFEKTHDDDIGMKLVVAVKASSALGALRVDMLKPRFDKFGERVRQQAQEVYASLNVDASKQRARLEEMLPTLGGGDIRRGQAVFNGAKAACLTCHAVGYVGGKVGPDLTKIGQTRTDRDLLEAILFPSLSFVRSYEPVAVATREGKVVSGLLRKDSADEVVLAVNATEEAHVPRAEVEEMRPGAVSVMPAGLDQQLSRQDLADLLAFLKSRK